MWYAYNDREVPDKEDEYWTESDLKYVKLKRFKTEEELEIFLESTYDTDDDNWWCVYRPGSAFSSNPVECANDEEALQNILECVNISKYEKFHDL